jgi:hypothetical protein
VPDRAYTEAQIDEAIAAINEPERLREAQEMVARIVPALQRVLGQALADGGWFDQALEQAVRGATTGGDPEDRVRAVRTLVAEETRLGMLVGVAVGFELAHELGAPTPSTTPHD